MGDVGNRHADDEAAVIIAGRVRLGVHGVVVILGVGRIDGDDRQAPPILAMAKRSRTSGLRLGLRIVAEHVRDRVGVDGDQADRAFAGERAEFLDHAPGRQSQARRALRLDRDQVAVLRVGGSAGRNAELFAEHFLVDRLQPAAAVRRFAENPQHAVLGMVDDLDDAPAVADTVVFLGFLNVQQHAVADAGGLARPRLARRVDADFRCRAVRLLVPFVGCGDEVAVAITRGDVGEHGGGQSAAVMQFLAALLDSALVAELAQHALELGAHGVLEAEGAGDLAGADFAGPLAYEGENVSLGGEGRSTFGLLVQNRFSCANN